jgi:hypothetical protein
VRRFESPPKDFDLNEPNVLSASIEAATAAFIDAIGRFLSAHQLGGKAELNV